MQLSKHRLHVKARTAKGYLLAYCITLFTLLTTSENVEAKSAFGQYDVDYQYSETVKESFYVTLRDGVQIAVAIVRPAQNGVPVSGKFPVIWHHTLSISREERDGTGGFISDLHAIPTLARHGYVVAQVARRGNGQSFGTMRGYHDRNEAQDAYELTQWFANQPWSDGNVGVYGCSNTGDAAMHAMSTRPPALKAVFAGCFSWHKYDAFRRGAIFAQWGTGPARTLADDMAIPPVDGDEDKQLLQRAAEEHQLATPLLKMWAEIPFRDSWSSVVGSRFWSEGSAASYADQIRRANIPLYVMGGWFDELRDQGFYTYMNVPDTKVVMGPWQHCRNDDFPLLAEIHRFFDQHLKQIDTGITAEPPIHYFVMEPDKQGRWASASDWPLKDQQMQQWYLGEGTLKQNNPSAMRVDFTVQPENECVGERISSRSQPCAEHPSGVSFTSAPLDQATEVTGHPVIHLKMASNATDANVFAYLEDIAPDGSKTVITEGRLKASMRAVNEPPWKMPETVPWHRHYQQDQQWLTAEEPVTLAFDLLPTSWKFKPGHRIQLTITGSDYRERLREPGTQQTMISLLSDQATLSHLLLPVSH